MSLLRALLKYLTNLKIKLKKVYVQDNTIVTHLYIKDAWHTQTEKFH
jgi:hypothetical protein